MPKRNDRVVIDTNLWISFLLTKNFSKLDHIISDHSIVLLFSKELLDEFIEVTNRFKFRKYFIGADLEKLLQQINLYAEFVSVTTFVKVCRDAKDDFLLSLALEGKATHLITGDKDLLVLEKFNETSVVTITNYLSVK